MPLTAIEPYALRLWNSGWSDSACSAQKWMLKRASSDSSTLCQYRGGLVANSPARIGKAVIGDGALHHAELAEHPGRGVVVGEQGLGHVLAGEKGGGTAYHPVRRDQLHGHIGSPRVAGSTRPVQ